MPCAGQAVSAARHTQPARLGQHCQVMRGNTPCKSHPAAHSRADACLAQLHVLALHLGRCRQCLTGRVGQAVLRWVHLTRQRSMRQTAPVPVACCCCRWHKRTPGGRKSSRGCVSQATGLHTSCRCAVVQGPVVLEPATPARTDLPLSCLRKQWPTTTKWREQRAVSSTLAVKHTEVHQSMGSWLHMTGCSWPGKSAARIWPWQWPTGLSHTLCCSWNC